MNTKVSKLQMRAKAFLDVASELKELTPEDRAVLSCVIDSCEGIKLRAREAAKYRAAHPKLCRKTLIFENQNYGYCTLESNHDGPCY